MSDEQNDFQTVSSENFDQFMTEKLNLAEAVETAEEAEIVESVEEADVEEEVEEVEAEKKEPEKKKSKLEQRMHELTTKAKAEKERADALEARLKALETPKEPELKAEQSDKPKPEDFTDAFEYAEALADWKVDQKFKEQAKAEEQRKTEDVRKQVTDRWDERLTAAKAEIDDFDDVINSSPVMVSDPVRDAIVESEVGPQLAYHLASNPEIAEKLKTLSVANQLKELGKLELQFEKKPEPVKAPPVKASKAPAPISPIKSAATPDIKESPEGEWTGTYDEFVAARRAGKIK